jgi:hypothetical protein
MHTCSVHSRGRHSETQETLVWLLCVVVVVWSLSRCIACDEGCNVMCFALFLVVCSFCPSSEAIQARSSTRCYINIHGT